MSQRESQIPVSLQQWRGVDQRTSPVLVQDGFFVMSRGVFFGLGENAERVPGKKAAYKFTVPVFNLVQFGNMVLIQTMNNVWIVPVQELTDLNILPPIAATRITEAGDVRITEAGDKRVIDEPE